MTKSPAKAVVHEVDDAVDEVLHQLKIAGERIGREGEDALSQAAARLSQAAHALAVEARDQSRRLSKDAVRQVKDHPMASAAIAASAAALIGLALARRAK
jgi:ElaB/YqjD/DUF883 family membrane-anchored ribosome-binding protein